MDPWADREDWSATPAVDPWADQDTPWQAELPFPEAMPPTRIESADAADPDGGTPPPDPDGSPLPRPGWRHSGPRPGPRRPAGHPGSDPAGARPNALLRPRRPSARPRDDPPQPVAATPAGSGSPRPLPRRPHRRRPAARRGWAARTARRQAANRLPVQPRPTGRHRPGPRAGRPGPPRPGPRRAPPRRKRRWPRRLFLFTLFSVVCCCGVPAYLAWPAAQQYPVSAALPQSVADLTCATTAPAGGPSTARPSSCAAPAWSRVRSSPASTPTATASGSPSSARPGCGSTPEADVEAEIARLTAEYDITDVESFDLGETGAHERCGVGRADGKAVVVCAWADHGSLATVLLTRRSVADSAELAGVLRSAVLTPG